MNETISESEDQEKRTAIDFVDSIRFKLTVLSEMFSNIDDKPTPQSWGYRQIRRKGGDIIPRSILCGEGSAAIDKDSPMQQNTAYANIVDFKNKERRLTLDVSMRNEEEDLIGVCKKCLPLILEKAAQSRNDIT
jgi:hypothetical protein